MKTPIVLTCGLSLAALMISAEAQLPSAPINLAAARSTLSPYSGVYQVHLTWQDTAGVITRNEVQRKEWSAGVWQSIGNIGNYDTDRGIGLKADTQYYYRVRAWNDSGASSFSNIANVTTATAPASIFLEAEQGQLTGAVVGNSGAGYTGSGFVDYVAASGEEVLLRPEIPQAGYYRMDIRYANGGAASRPLQVSVNGVVLASSLAFPVTGSWNSWATASVTGFFAFDDTFLRLRSIGSSGPNVDSVTIVPVFTGARVNFEPAGAAVPAGYVADAGAVYAARGNGFSYGWNVDNSANTRDRNNSLAPDQRFDTLTLLQSGGGLFWEFGAPNGRYAVSLTSGDPSFTDSVYAAAIEGAATRAFTPSGSALWTNEYRGVSVTDGRVTLKNGVSATNNKFGFVEIYPRGAQASVFSDDFTAASLGAWWTAAGWSILSGAARSTGGSAYLETTDFALDTDYVVETRAKGFFSITGDPANSFSIVFGREDLSSGNFYEVTLSEQGIAYLNKSAETTPSAGWSSTVLASAPLTLSSTAYSSFKIVRDGGTGRIQVFVDQGSGYPAVPLLDAADQSYAYRGHTGWWRATESANYDFLVDWFRVTAAP